MLVFQHGWGKQLLGFEATGGIVPFLPIFLFVILFGLSMDYHVFILSRIREAYDRGDTDEAVAHGIKTTAGVITSAALVMVCVFSVFGVLSFMLFKQIGVGLAAAILIDATIVRAVLLPAIDEAPRRLELVPAEVARVAAAPRARRQVETVEAPPAAGSVGVSEAASQPISERAHGEVWARVATERGLATGAIAVVALHVVDDSFLQPSRAPRRPTISSAASCRWRSLRAPRSCTARARRRVRATLALLVGFFGVLSGTEAVYYSLNGGPSATTSPGSVDARRLRAPRHRHA